MQSITHLHTFRLNASAKKVIVINDEQQINQIKGLTNGKDLIVLGEGSNTLFLEDYLGTVAVNCLKGIHVHSTENDVFVEVGAGENWHNFVEYCLNHNISGLENLALIPGTVGAAPIQNIGAYGLEVAKFIDHVDYVDLNTLEKRSLVNSECNFGYRDSIFKHDLAESAFITKVTFRITKNWQPILSYYPLSGIEKPTARAIYDLVCQTRENKLPDPKKLGNAGSFFKNPIVTKPLANKLLAAYPNMPTYEADNGYIKLAAAWLIERAGLKGECEGGICSYNNQALVLVNKSGHANGSEVRRFVKRIIQQVHAKFEVYLEPEVRLVISNGELNKAAIKESLYG